MHAESGKEMKRSHEAMESKGQWIFKVCDYVREDKHVKQGQVRYENNESIFHEIVVSMEGGPM